MNGRMGVHDFLKTKACTSIDAKVIPLVHCWVKCECLVFRVKRLSIWVSSQDSSLEFKAILTVCNFIVHSINIHIFVQPRRKQPVRSLLC